ELLESMLQDYEGTVILVSHDRAFLDNVVTQVFAFEGGGKIQEYVGGYAEWIAQRGTGVSSQNAVKNTVSSGFSTSGQAARKVKMSFNETRELETLPVKIQSLEKEQVTLQAKLAEGSIYAKAPDEAKAISVRLDALATEIDAAMVRWEMLELKRA
ncbi:MAG: ABC transporter ATP-binding protein, partial [Pseudomonadota bacterium]